MYNLNPTPSDRDGGGGGNGTWKTSPPGRKWIDFPKGARDNNYGSRINGPYEERERGDWSFRREDRERYPPRGKRDWEGREMVYRNDYRPPLDPPPSKRLKLDRDFKYYSGKTRSPGSPPNEKEKYREPYGYEPSRHYPHEPDFTRDSFYPHYPQGKGGSGARWERYGRHYDYPGHYNRLRELDREHHYRGRDYERYEDWEREKRGEPYPPRDPRDNLESRDYRLNHRFREPPREFYPPRDREFETREPREPRDFGNEDRDFEDPREFIGERRELPREFIGEGRELPREFIGEGRELPREFIGEGRELLREFNNSDNLRDSRDFNTYPREFYGDKKILDPEVTYNRVDPMNRDHFHYSTDRIKEDLKAREDFRKGTMMHSPSRGNTPEEAINIEYSENSKKQTTSLLQQQLQSTPSNEDLPAPRSRLGFGQGLVAFESSQPKEASPDSTTKLDTVENNNTVSLVPEINPIVNSQIQPQSLLPASQTPPISSIHISSPTPYNPLFSHPTNSALLITSPSTLLRTSSEDNIPRDPRLRLPNPPSFSPVISDPNTSATNIAINTNNVNIKMESETISSEKPVVVPPKVPLPSKEEILHSLEKLDSELSKIETQISNLKKPKKPEQKHGKHVPIEQIIKEENQETIKSQMEIWAALIPETLFNNTDPLYKEPSDLSIYHENINLHEKNKLFIAKVVLERNKQVKDLSKSLIETFLHYQETWQKKVAKLEQKRAKKDKKQKKTSTSAASNSSNSSKEDNFYPSHRRPLLSARNRVTRSQTDLFVRSEEELEQVVDNLRKEEDPDSPTGGKYVHTLVRIPDMILDPHTPKFIDDNGLMVDPMAIERERKLINLWTDEEKEIFLEKFLIYHKNFTKIAEFLKNKTTENVIWYYYANKRTLDLKKLKEQQPKRRVYRKPSSASLTQTSQIQSVQPNTFIPRELANLGITSLDKASSPLSRRVDEKSRRTGPRPSLLGPSASNNSMNNNSSSAVSNLVNNNSNVNTPLNSLNNNVLSPPSTSHILATTNTNSPFIDSENRWTDTERELFKEGLDKFGADFKSISQLLGTKNPFQCKNYYHNLKKKRNAQDFGSSNDQSSKSKSPSLVKSDETEKEDSNRRDMNTEDNNYVSSNLNSEFQEQEVNDLIKYFEAYGKSWKKIANLIPSKTPAQLRAFFKANKKLFESKLPVANPLSPVNSLLTSPPMQTNVISSQMPVAPLIIDLSTKTVKKEEKENSKKRPRKAANEKTPLLSEKVDKRKKKQKIATTKPVKPEESPTIIISTLPSPHSPSPLSLKISQPTQNTYPHIQSLPSHSMNRSSITLPNFLDSLFLLASVSEQRIQNVNDSQENSLPSQLQSSSRESSSNCELDEETVTQQLPETNQSMEIPSSEIPSKSLPSVESIEKINFDNSNQPNKQVLLTKPSLDINSLVQQDDMEIDQEIESSNQKMDEVNQPSAHLQIENKQNQIEFEEKHCTTTLTSQESVQQQYQEASKAMEIQTESTETQQEQITPPLKIQSFTSNINFLTHFSQSIPENLPSQLQKTQRPTSLLMYPSSETSDFNFTSEIRKVQSLSNQVEDVRSEDSNLLNQNKSKTESEKYDPAYSSESPTPISPINPFSTIPKSTVHSISSGERYDPEQPTDLDEDVCFSRHAISHPPTFILQTQQISNSFHPQSITPPVPQQTISNTATIQTTGQTIESHHTGSTSSSSSSLYSSASSNTTAQHADTSSTPVDCK